MNRKNKRIYDTSKMIRIQKPTLKKLSVIADSRGESVSNVIRTAIRAEIEYAPELENEHK